MVSLFCVSFRVCILCLCVYVSMCTFVCLCSYMCVCVRICLFVFVGMCPPNRCVGTHVRYQNPEWLEV